MRVKSYNKYWRICCLVISISIIYACNPTKKVLKRQNIAYQYQIKNFDNPLKIKFYHENTNSNLLLVGIESDKLKENVNQWVLTIKAYNSYDNKIPFDTFSTPIDFQQNVYKIRLPNSYYSENNIIIDASLINLKNQKLYKNRYVVEADDPNKYYLLKNINNDEPIFQTYVHPKDEISIEYKGEDLTNFSLTSYAENSSLPLPPYSEQEIKPLNKQQLTSYQESMSFQLRESGPYLISFPNTKDTLALSCMNEKFPKLANVSDLVQCLRYLTKKEEYQAMLNSNNLEASIDSFWLDKAGSAERAKVLIREFYGRVQRANQFFSTDKIGWKTDRGLIYIIYGQAEIVYNRSDEEIWKYVLPATAGSSNGYVVFHFQKEKNIYGQLNYHLFRDRDYEDSWHYVINEWRNGRISNISY